MALSATSHMVLEKRPRKSSNTTSVLRGDVLQIKSRLYSKHVYTHACIRKYIHMYMHLQSTWPTSNHHGAAFAGRIYHLSSDRSSACEAKKKKKSPKKKNQKKEKTLHLSLLTYVKRLSLETGPNSSKAGFRDVPVCLFPTPSVVLLMCC